MKKLFLTSGIIACMACPAFADFDPLASENPTNPIAGACEYENLNAYTGSSTLTAQWEKAWHFINLDEDQVDTENNATGAGAANASTDPDPLFSIYHDYNVYQDHDGSAQDQSDWVITDPVSYGDQATNVVITTVPAGKSVNYTFIDTLSSSSMTTSMDNPVAATRTFLGYYQNPNSTGTSSVSGAGNQYVDATGHLTQAGSTASYGYQADQTWYAYYNCATPKADSNGTALSAPTKDGYTFAGWWTTAEDTDQVTGTQVNLGCIDQDTTLYARWTALPHTITYNCGAPLNGSDSHVEGPATASAQWYTDATYTLAAADNCSLPGYTFLGWDCSNLPGTGTVSNDTGIGSSTLFAAGATGTYNYNGNVTCTARWTQNQIGLTWTLNNGTGTVPQDASCFYDGAITLPANPTRTGYTFQGWDVTATDPADQDQQTPVSNEPSNG